MNPAPLILLFTAAALVLSCNSNREGNHEDGDEHAGEHAEEAAWSDVWDGQTLAGWSMAGPGEFLIEDGTLKATGGMGLLWYSDESFRDFSLRLQWKVESASDNSGVFVRFPNPGDDPWVAVNEGYELQICDAADALHDTGSVYSFQGSTSVPTRPIGEWNDYEITVVGQRYTVKVNGQLVNEFEGERSREGHFGIQNHDDGSPVRFRGFQVRRLGDHD